jgi:hypothetical protein
MMSRLLPLPAKARVHHLMVVKIYHGAAPLSSGDHSEPELNDGGSAPPCTVTQASTSTGDGGDLAWPARAKDKERQRPQFLPPWHID